MSESLIHAEEGLAPTPGGAVRGAGTEGARVISGPPPSYGAHDSPPSYDDVTDPNAPPPSYDSIYGELRQVRSPMGFLGFIRKTIGIFVGTVIFLIFLAVLSILPIVLIVVGIVYRNDCPVEHYIPVYLIVAGVFLLLKSLTNAYYGHKARQNPSQNPQETANPNPFDGLLNCFLLAWFITGTIWVYRVSWPDLEHPNTAEYCNPTLYYTAFFWVTIQYVIMVVFIALMCCCGFVAFCAAIAE